MTDLQLPELLDLLPVMDRAMPWARAGLAIVIGWFLARLISMTAERLAKRHTSAQNAMLARRVLFYSGLILAVATALGELGFDLSVLLGAAGVATVAIGFASQTAASNIISGAFLVGERPFVVGDMIRIGNTTGEVVTVDLLSVSLRTLDNLLVRVPNETLIKTEITNLTHFPIRRFDLQIGVAYKEDLRRVHEVLYRVADALPICLDEPKPRVLHQGFGDSSVNLQFSVFALTPNYWDLRNEVTLKVKEAFDAEGIEIPFPHRTVYTGAVTAPMPVRLVSEP